MCTLTVKIHLPGVSVKDITIEPSWFQKDNKVVIDEAFLERAIDDDSFYAFELNNIQEDSTNDSTSPKPLSNSQCGCRSTKR